MPKYKGSYQDWATIRETIANDEENSALGEAIDEAMEGANSYSTIKVEVPTENISFLLDIMSQEDITDIKSA